MKTCHGRSCRRQEVTKIDPQINTWWWSCPFPSSFFAASIGNHVTLSIYILDDFRRALAEAGVQPNWIVPRLEELLHCVGPNDEAH